MASRPYTASERRGIIVIAILALLFIGAGVGFSFFHNETSPHTPEVTVIPETLDSVATEKAINEKSKKKTKKSSRSKSGKSSSKKKSQKIYRQRSPLDEPV